MKAENINVAYRAACEGMVLLENRENTLPIKDKSAALLGAGSWSYQKGGGGSSAVFCGDVSSLADELRKTNIAFLPESLCLQDEYTDELIGDWSRRASVAVTMFFRLTGEGADRPVSDFELKPEEIELLEKIENSDFESAVVILNIGSPINVAAIKKYSKVKAILLSWHAGMCGPQAIADILCGNVNPSGRLTDTFAEKYEDYPSAKEFGSDLYFEYYSEDIFVGYRYFETFAKEKVVYPFGYGLSYTDFEISLRDISSDGEKIDLSVAVKNIGKIAGKETVQVYNTYPTGRFTNPALALRTFAKTKELAPGEEEILSISFAVSDMANFDERIAAYVLGAGEYNILCGKNVRDTIACGTFFAETDTVTEQLSLMFSTLSPSALTEDGELIRAPRFDARCTPPIDEAVRIPDAEGISLIDVDEGRMTLDEFVSKLSVSQLINLLHGKPPAVIRGTGGIGNMPELGIPNPQTADGPAGVRRTVATVCFPCATALACAWNSELLFEVGKTIARECDENGVDILLAPGLNIHRNPLCGRNFEYYSEDPMVSGLSATAMVKGVQSLGIAATVKHFAANNRELCRKRNDSRVSERALREIYLKGFETVIKNAKPMCVMTSYNKVNGLSSSANRALIEGILRGEWGFDGLIMTDWETTPTFTDEILAGNNLRMPYAFERDIALTEKDYDWKSLRRDTLEYNAKHVLRLIMKTKTFKARYFGPVHSIGNGKNVIDAEICRLASSSIIGLGIDDNGEKFIFNLGKNENDSHRIYLLYRIVSDKTRTVRASVLAALADEGLEATFSVNGACAEPIHLTADTYSLENAVESAAAEITLPEGESELCLEITGSKERDCMRLWKIIIE